MADHRRVLRYNGFRKIPVELKSYNSAPLELFTPTLPTHPTPRVKMAAWEEQTVWGEKRQMNKSQHSVKESSRGSPTFTGP